MSIQEAVLSRSRTTLVLATLFLGMFVLGSAELLVVGVLNLIAADLQVSIPAAGTLVTVYALGLAIGGPILTALTIKLNKRIILIGTLVLFILGNLVAVLTTSYGLLLAARTLTGALQGLFIATAFVAGISVVPPERMGRAIAVVISGVAASAALGVPLGTLVGQELGWRGSFTAIVALAVIALIATLALVPSVPSTGSGAAGQAKYAFAPRVLAVLVLNFLIFAALYAALTYIVPFLEEVTGISGALISVFLLAYGVATVAGSFAGGRLADQNAARTLLVATVGTAVALLVLYFVGTVAFLVALVLMALGLFIGGMMPSLQYRVVSLADWSRPSARTACRASSWARRSWSGRETRAPDQPPGRRAGRGAGEIAPVTLKPGSGSPRRKGGPRRGPPFHGSLRTGDPAARGRDPSCYPEYAPTYQDPVLLSQHCSVVLPSVSEL